MEKPLSEIEDFLVQNDNSEAGEEEEKEESLSKRRYVQVASDKRQELLNLLQNEQVTIKEAAERLNINYSTAKNIVKLYKKEKRITPHVKRTCSLLKETEEKKKEIGVPFSQIFLPFFQKEEAEVLLLRASKKPLDKVEFFKNFSESVKNYQIQKDQGTNQIWSQQGPVQASNGSGNVTEESRHGPKCDCFPKFNFLVYSPLILAQYSSLSLIQFPQEVAEPCGER
eukprot:TRINITY_DN33_c0_g1_i1.p2 TRINITY_DN33_c0_g1~~TRINITY_DN33_c0_g1_i1.p2  ORF type:complete len:226 (+),score=24.40 TRINITY_DN33_c0_g1_i1:273-950(+)